MKPRIFVSSTFYDLKYVREDLAEFIRAHDFEAILFEDGDIGFNSGTPLDESCYETMKTADMAILIIGGRYGSNATNQETDNIDDFISITQKEFKTAIENGIPVYAFIDSKVNTEFDIYKKNADKINNDPQYIDFSSTDDIRIFKFIKQIYDIIYVQPFNKISDIKEYLSKQWSDMFKKYLSQLKDKKEIETIKSTVAQLEKAVKSMSLMLDAVGEIVLKEDNKYDDVKNRQRAIELCEKIKNIFNIIDDRFTTIEERSSDIIKMLFEWNEFVNKCKEESMDSDIINEDHTKNKNVKLWDIANSYNFVVGIDFTQLINSINDICEDLNNEVINKLVYKELIKGYYYKLYSKFSNLKAPE